MISTPQQQVLENCELITSPEVEEDDYYYEDHAESGTPEPLLEQLGQIDDDDVHINCSIDEELCDKTDNEDETSVTDEDEAELIAIDDKIVVDLVQKCVESSINEEIEKLEVIHNLNLFAYIKKFC